MIVAAADAGIRAELRAKALGAGLRCDGEISSPAFLAERLALQGRAEDTLVIVAETDDAGLGRLALARGVPVLTWPDRGTATARQSDAVRERPLPSEPRGRRLTPREREVLALVAAGISNKSIARSLKISPNTVKFHMTTLFAKLGVATRAEAIAAAARSGELSL